MKWMTKLRLINWHYFRDETIEIGKQTMLSGRNAAGKSTIIDALQILFVANLKQIRFNSSAHDEAKRSLISYLKGKIGSDAYVRNGDFSTYLAAEFFDDAKKEYFIIGVVFDVYRDDEYRDEYFIISDTRLSELDIIKENGKLKNKEEFHHYCKHLSQRVILENNKAGYQKALLARFGQLSERFFSTFIKALSFKPIQNVRDFVYEHILDSKELKIDILKQNFELYKKYEKDLQQLQEKKEQLMSIQQSFSEFEKWRDIVLEQDYIIHHLSLKEREEELETKQIEINKLEEKETDLKAKRELFEEQKEKAHHQFLESYNKWQKNDIKQELDKLNEKKKDLKGELAKSESQLKALIALVHDERLNIERLLAWSGNTYFQWNEQQNRMLEEKLERLTRFFMTLNNTSDQEDSSFLVEEIKEDLNDTGILLADLYDQMVMSLTNINNDKEKVRNEIEALEQEIKNLEKKKRPYPASVHKLHQILDNRLSGESAVKILCEEMEIKNEEWRDAIEGYLHTQRFDLLVEPSCFAQALSIYEKEKYTEKLEGVGLVDTEKEKKYLGLIKAGSLAEELEAEHPVIQARIAHLLGHVMKANNEHELRLHPTAITATCMSYHNLVARQIPKERYSIPYIGAKAIERQLEIKKQLLLGTRARLHKLMQEQNEIEHWKQTLTEKKARYQLFVDQINLPTVIRNLKNEIAKVQEEINNKDTQEIEKLESDYKYYQEKFKRLDESLTGIVSEHSKIESRILFEKDKEKELIRLVEEAKDELEKYIEYLVGVSPNLLERANHRLNETEKQVLAISDKLRNMRINHKGNETRRDNEFDDVKTKRGDFNRKYSYNGKIDHQDNHEYQKLLEDIEGMDIPNYLSKLEEAADQSESEFKSNFIYKMKEAIDEARFKFRELNNALKQFPFSEDRYHFEVKPSEKYRKFYDVIMDPQIIEKDSLFSIPNEEKAMALKELSDKLIRGDAGEQEEFTDYRYYLDFDIIITNGENKQYFSKVLKEKSGGETQTPFYIAILASLNYLYSSGKTVRLVVFDEAFNKMDEERIQTSLRLIRRMNLQLICAVPDEKIAHMINEVTTTIIVNRDGFTSFTDMISREELTGNNEHERSMEDRDNQEVSVQDTLFAIEEV